MTSAAPKPRTGEHVPLPPNACGQCGQIGGEHLAHCLLAERDALLSRNAELVEACQAAIAYDAAIQSAANSPEKMASFCTAEGEDLDTLYAAWIDKARTALKAPA